MYTAVPRQQRLDSALLNARSLAIMCAALFNRASGVDVEPRDCFGRLLKEHAESLALDSENQTTCKTKAQKLENGKGEEARRPTGHIRGALLSAGAPQRPTLVKIGQAVNRPLKCVLIMCLHLLKMLQDLKDPLQRTKTQGWLAESGLDSGRAPVSRLWGSED